MLNTDIKHIQSDEDYKKTLMENENVMICCGRNGPMCLPVYDIMETIEKTYDNVTFRVMDYDGPAGASVASLPETRGFMGLPFTVYYKGGEVMKATGSIQDKAQITAILDQQFAK